MVLIQGLDCYRGSLAYDLVKTLLVEDLCQVGDKIHQHLPLPRKGDRYIDGYWTDKWIDAWDEWIDRQIDGWMGR